MRRSPFFIYFDRVARRLVLAGPYKMVGSLLAAGFFPKGHFLDARA